MTFLGDEGRDVIVVRRFLVELRQMLIGPGTSIGNMYLGPLYYYLVAPALFLAAFSPVGPAVLVALIGIATIFLVWFIGRKWFGPTGGLASAALYALAPAVIIYARSSWNPNIMPFFSLLAIFLIWKIFKVNRISGKVGWWLIILGVTFAFVLQSHYLGLLLLPTAGLFWLMKLVRLKERKQYLFYSLLSVLVFLFLMSPLVIFDARHGWRNFAAVKIFFTVRQETVSIRPWKAIPKAWPVWQKAVTNLVTAGNQTLGLVTSLVLAGYLVWSLVKKKNVFLLTWLGFAVLGLSLYKQEIYDHYYGFFFTAPFLLLGGLVTQILKIKSKIPNVLLLLILGSLVWINLTNSPLFKEPNYQLRRAKEVAQKINGEAKGKQFNLAVIAERNYQDGYKYFLLLAKAAVVEIDAQKPETITDQLFVVCEMPPEKCDPTHSPKAEVANFGWSKIESAWEVSGARLYKLAHTK